MSRIAIEYVCRLSTICDNSGPVIKTHDLYAPDLHRNLRYIFLFSDPLDSALSVANMGKVHGIDWIKRHVCHLKGKGSTDNIYHEDVLNYEEQLRSWGEAQDTLVIHYDDLWSSEEELSEFVGFKIKLPGRKVRASKALPADYNKALFERLKRAEKALREKK
ncbi:MAG: hypothetical protein Cons2KO_10440 [Congregibacter sp.]